MPRKSILNELQAEETAANSPVRRSTRIVNGNGTPVGVTTRRTSQTTDSDTPARATRSRRTSTQAAEEKIETKTSGKSKQASILTEEDSQKQSSVPARRGRKSSVTSEKNEPADKEELENSKPVRTRRNSRANSEDNEGEKPQRAAPARGRRSSVTAEPESEVTVSSKPPARTSARRRSSTTENLTTDEVSTPVKRATRGRKASDAEEVIEETKKPVTKGRRKSVNQEDETKVEELPKPAPRRGRKTSTGDIEEKATPKTPGRTRGRSLTDTEYKDSVLNEPKHNSDKTDSSAEEEISPFSLKEISVKVTPLKKRKILEKMDSELDLSIINESLDDVNGSKNEESLKENKSPAKSVEHSLVHVSEEPDLNDEMSHNADISKNSQNIGKIDNVEDKDITDIPRESPSKSTTSPTSRKRLSAEINNKSSPRKSPRLSEKLSRSNTPQKELTFAENKPSSRLSEKASRTDTSHKESSLQENKLTPTKSGDLLKEVEQEPDVNGKSQPLFVSSGSDSSFRFHLSAVSVSENIQRSEQENLKEDHLNSSKESTGSNKENIELSNSAKNKEIFEKSAVVLVQEKVVIPRVSNVFKPNQKEYSFMEPMEIDCSIIACNNSVMDNSVALDESIVFNRKTGKITEKATEVLSVNDNDTVQESSSLYNKKMTPDMFVEQSDEISSNTDKYVQKNSSEVVKLFEEALKPSCTETEGSDNIVIEETEESVDMSIKPSPKKSVNTVISGSKSPINNPVEKVKIMFSRKSSSPINIKRKSLRKSKSPLPGDGSSTDSDNEGQYKLRVSRPLRRSKSKSKTPSPTKTIKNNLLILKTSESKPKSPVSLNSSNDDGAEFETSDNALQSEASSKEKRFSRSPSFLSPDAGNISKTRKDSVYLISGNRAARSKSTSPLPQTESILQCLNEAERSGGSKGSSKQNPDEKDTASLEQSFEKSRGSDEILVSNEKIVLNTSDNSENLPRAKLPSKVINEMSSFDQSTSEQAINQDRTEYHTAIATTCGNNTEFDSIINVDSDVIQMETKNSESTHYDFDLPSDDDDDDPLNYNNSMCDKGTTVEQDEIVKQVQETKGKNSTGSDSEIKSKESNSREQVELSIENTSDSEDDVFEEESIKRDPREKIKLEDSTSQEDKIQKCANIKNGNEFNNLTYGVCSDKEINTSFQEENLKNDAENTQPDKRISEKVVPNLEDGIENIEESTEGGADISEKLTVQTENSEIVNLADNSIEMESTNMQDNVSVCDNSFDKASAIEKDSERTSLPANSSKTTVETDVLVIRLKNNSFATTKSTVESKPKGNTSNASSKKLESNVMDVGESKESVDNTEEITSAGNGDKDEKTEKHSTKIEGRILKEATETVTGHAVEKTEQLDDISTKTTNKVEDSKPVKSKPSLDDFAAAKLSDYLKSKAKEFEESSSEEEADGEESDEEYDDFIDGMAEEGEEDTPSEDSNQIVDEGESIGSSDFEDMAEEDDYDEDDSFICDEGDLELLSGEEYDLGQERKKKPRKSRIIDPNTLGDDEIIKVTRKKKDEEKPKRKSRIIKMSDSSSEEESNFESLEVKNEDTKDRVYDGSVIVIGDSKDEENIKSETIETSGPSLRDNVIIKDNEETEEAEIKESSNVILIEDSRVEEVSNNESLLQNTSLNVSNASLQKRNRKSSLTIQENIVLDGTKDLTISKRINSLVESFCSTVKKGEVALNLSLEYEDSTESLAAKESESTESVHILSDVKICPGTVSSDAQEQDVPRESDIEKEMSTSLDQIKDLRQVLNKKKLKRRLSRSLSEINEEEKNSKRRKKDKKKNKRSASHEKTGKHNKKEKLLPDITEDLKLASFGLMNQLITDVKNRPKRVVRPTTSIAAGSSWTETKVSNLKPSTSPAHKFEKMKVVPKFHPKDFKNQLLADSKRVKRVETKTLLKKRGAFL